jgi:RES domain-containing protein
MLTRETLINELKRLTPNIEKGFVFRIIDIKYQTTALSAIGSLKSGGRYNIGESFSEQQFSALYASDSPITALQEREILLNSGSGLIPNLTPPYLLLSLKYTLQSVLDLTDTYNQNALGTNLQELTGNWRVFKFRDQIAPTQELAKAVYDLQTIEALKVPSQYNINAYNLVIFPERLLPNSFIEVYDPSGTIAAKLP